MSNGIVLPRHRNILKTIFPEPDLSGTIARVMREEVESGVACGWRSCTGCHETNEGAETGDYPYSPMFQAFVGSGCGECGGIGVVWEYWSKDDLKAMAEGDASMSPWQPIADAPHDRPVLVYYDHDADTYYEPENPNRLTGYAANADGVGYVAGAGQIVAMWCDGYHEDDGHEDPTGGYWVPGGWFPCINGEPQDYVCNALFWRELDANPQEPVKRDDAS